MYSRDYREAWIEVSQSQGKYRLVRMVEFKLKPEERFSNFHVEAAIGEFKRLSGNKRCTNPIECQFFDPLALREKVSN